MRFLIDFIDSISEIEINQYLLENNCTIIKVFSFAQKTYLIESNNEPISNHLITSIIKDESIEIKPLSYLENSMITVDITNEDNWWKTVSIHNIDMNIKTVDIERSGHNSCVYVIDSGINHDHVDLLNITVKNIYSFNNDHKDYHGHGTAIASVISGETCGMTDARICSAKIFQQDIPTYQSHLLEALEAVYQEVLSQPNIFHIVNISWVISKNLYVENKIRQLINAGVWVVCSAGNNGQEVENLTPAGMSETFTVGSFDRNLIPCDFSNYSSAIDNTASITNTGSVWGWAPGEHIKIAKDSGFDYASGTSISAAIASATLAYNSYLWMNGSKIPLEIKRTPILLSSMSRGNYQLINLSEKYKTSSDFTFVFVPFSINKGTYDSDKIPGKSAQVVLVKSGEIFDLLVLDPLLEETVIEISELPQGVTLTGNYIEGQIFTDTYIAKKITIKTHLSRGDEWTHTVVLYAVADNFDPNMIPKEDMLTDVSPTALVECCYYDGILNECTQTAFSGCRICGACDFEKLSNANCLCRKGYAGSVTCSVYACF